MENLNENFHDEVCPNCKDRNGLYKDYTENGECKITCFKCRWESESLPGHWWGKIKVRDIQRLKQDWL